MQEEPFYFTPRRSEVLRPIFRLLLDLRFVDLAEGAAWFQTSTMLAVAVRKTAGKRQYAAFGRFSQTGLTACVGFALLSAKRYFALECFARTRTGFVALNEPNQPRLGSLALPRSPESGVEVSTHTKNLSREKTLYLEDFLWMCLYLVVSLQLRQRPRSWSNTVNIFLII